MNFLDLRHLLPLLIIGGGFAFVGTILYGSWMLGRYRGREDEMPGEIANLDARLQRLEYLISQTTGALDRLEAAHRLTARMMTETPNNASGRPLLRQTTPH
ncbi:MAG TPA: hypothetical protein VK636_07755 [Gemmatimonadaceae bacterium]|nr:hypothetical protein [Gemmatimonadaceae bacterium]